MKRGYREAVGSDEAEDELRDQAEVRARSRWGVFGQSAEDAYLEEDDDDDDDKSNMKSRNDRSLAQAPSRPSQQPPQQQQVNKSGHGDDDGDEEEEDPLEAFMAGVAKEVETNKPPSTTEQKGRRADVEGDEDGDDHVDSYIQMMKRKGIDVTDADAMAKRRAQLDKEQQHEDAEAMGGNDDNEEDGGQRRKRKGVGEKEEIAPLPRVDHAQIAYAAFEKDFFEPHDDILALTDDEIATMRRDLNMHVTGFAPPPPGFSWAHFGFGDILMQALVRTGWAAPTGIQQQALPAALAGRDLLAIAKTGSGKTAAYLLPLMVHCMDQPVVERGEGPIGLILAPTRELAIQILNECKKLGKVYGIRSAVLYGGADKTAQFKELRNGCEILIATPGRLIDLIKMKATNLRRVTYLVLDEADRMFDLGFEPQVQSISDQVRPTRQTLLFSATLPNRVEFLARQALTDPIKIVIGQIGQANTDVKQSIHIVPSNEYKYTWLTSHLPAFLAAGTMIIFVGQKGGVDGLSANLVAEGFPVGGMHGDMLQGERDRVMRRFKKGDIKVLIATDIASRGLDIKHVRTVINYDIARDIDSHIHRVGRTGRAGEKGDAHTLLTEKEDRFAADLVRSLETAGDQPIPADLMRLAMRNGRFRSFREGNGGGRWHRGGGGRGRGRGRGLGYVAGDGHHGEHHETNANLEPIQFRQGRDL